MTPPGNLLHFFFLNLEYLSCIKAEKKQALHNKNVLNIVKWATRSTLLVLWTLKSDWIHQLVYRFLHMLKPPKKWSLRNWREITPNVWSGHPTPHTPPPLENYNLLHLNINIINYTFHRIAFHSSQYLA